MKSRIHSRYTAKSPLQPERVLAGSQVTPEQIAAVGCGMEKNAVGILGLPGDGLPQQVLVPFRGLSSGSGQRQADGLRLVALGDDPHQDVVLPESCNGEDVSLGIEELHAAVTKGRVLLFELAQAVVPYVACMNTSMRH